MGYIQKDVFTIGGYVPGILADFIVTDIQNNSIYEAGLYVTLTDTLCRWHINDSVWRGGHESTFGFERTRGCIQVSLKVENDKRIYHRYYDREKQNHTISNQKPRSQNSLLYITNHNNIKNIRTINMPLNGLKH